MEADWMRETGVEIDGIVVALVKGIGDIMGIQPSREAVAKAAAAMLAVFAADDFVSSIVATGTVVYPVKVNLKFPDVPITSGRWGITSEITEDSGKNVRLRTTIGQNGSIAMDGEIVVGTCSKKEQEILQTANLHIPRSTAPIHLSSEDWGDVPFSGPAQQTDQRAKEMGDS